MYKYITFILLLTFSLSVHAGKIFYSKSDSQENLKKLLNEFSVPYRTFIKNNYEWMVWPDEYNAKVEVIINHSGDYPTSKVDLLIGLGKTEEGVSLLRKLAADGVPEAQHQLAVEYIIGRYIKRNYLEAKKWYKRAIKSGSVSSYTSLGVLYENGWGVKKNEKTAYNLYQKAANKNELAAMCKIGNFYRDGKAGLPIDLKKADSFYNRVKKMSKSSFNCTRVD